SAGAKAATWVMLRLPLEVSPLFREWLAAHYPDRAGRVMSKVRDMHGGRDYASDWGRRMRGSGPYAELIAQRFRLATRRLGLDQPQPELRCDLFAVPKAPEAQLSLF
ncbi:MAG: radical SAM protein, partial [Pseudomonadota bacterium]